MKWTQNIITTTRGEFEIFTKGEGHPLCVTHHYSEFNETGDFFADAFTKTNQVFLINLREAGNSAKAEQPHQLSLLETVLDLEAIREALGFDIWGFAGHSTGGMLGIVYGIYFSEKLSFDVIVGAAAREYMTFSEDCIYNEQHPQFEKMQELMENLKQPGLSAEEKSNLKIQRTKLSLANPDKYDDYFTQDIRKELSAVRLNFFSRELHVFDVTRKLGIITAPTLIMCGRHDVQCPLEYSVEMNELIPGSTLAIFEDSNHYPFLEEAERFGEVYQSFITSHIDK
ncbi:alpha/beta fold hydrolase [Planomicrobium okeanokoites]|uniref:Alpha/beta fold hydrolase n=1 Tax=Planomicrobium okeanokoites TaxID=244 RepID=A0ABV7KSR1_PLAOK|nr:alpha/beta hydrolase [Planomicrobium okeanokoites]TAA70267.1 alpha/beta hydrolase [Planomicrobium okeanokoites]